MDFVQFIEESVEQKRLLNEASEIEVTKEIFELYVKVMFSLSNAFLMMNNSSNIDGDGNVVDQLRKTGNALADIQKKLKPMKNSKDKETFDSGLKKSLGEITSSLKSIKEKIEKSIIPSIVVEPEETDFTEYLEETIKAGYKNEELWLDYLKEKYSKVDVEKYYISFVAIDKVGINPQTVYDTPIGVYTYPLKFVLEEEYVPFRGDTDSNKIKIIKRVSENGLTSKATEDDVKKCEKYLKEKYEITDEEIEEYTKNARKKTNFGIIWNLTRRSSMKVNKERNMNKPITPKSISLWTKIFLELGYEYAEDDGLGIIHPNEKTQAVFFSPKSYKVIDEQVLDTAEKYKLGNKKFQKVDLWTPTRIKEIINMKQYRQFLVTDDEGEDALLAMLRLSRRDSNELKIVFDYSIKHQSEEFLKRYLYQLFNNPNLNYGENSVLGKYGKPLMKKIVEEKSEIRKDHKNFYKRFFEENEDVYAEFSINGEPTIILNDFLKYIS